MPHPIAPTVRDALRAAITDAIRRRDRSALSVYRTALGAIDNAEAVPLTDSAHGAGAIESSRVGVGAADAERRHLAEDDMRAIVRAEADERRVAAAALAAHPGQLETVARLHAEATLLDTLLGNGVGDGGRTQESTR